MEAQEYFDIYIAKRGISKELAAARGYRPWDGVSGAEVIAEGFEGLHEGGLRWLMGIASNEDENGVGFTIPRRPIPIEVEPGTFPEWFDHTRIFPGIKTEEAVATGTRRHFHGHVESVFELLPEQVLWAMCKPTMGQFTAQFHTLHFEHSHEGMEEAGTLVAHMRAWHGVSRFRDVHSHSLRIFKPETMKGHITTESGKLTEPHLGTNTNEIHKHVQKAKYLYAPHPYKDPVSWDSDHTHEGMEEDELAWHLEHKH